MNISFAEIYEYLKKVNRIEVEVSFSKLSTHLALMKISSSHKEQIDFYELQSHNLLYSLSEFYTPDFIIDSDGWIEHTSDLEEDGDGPLCFRFFERQPIIPSELGMKLTT